MSLFTPLTPATGWEEISTLEPAHFAPVGYYVHKGRAYICGGLNNRRGDKEGWAEIPAPGTLLMVVPPAIRPSVAQGVVLPVIPILTTDALNPALKLKETYASTIHPDGTWTLDEEVEDQLVKPPSAAEWYYQIGNNPEGKGESEGNETVAQYTAPLRLALALGNASWDLAPRPDKPELHPLGAFLKPDFTDAASKYLDHGNRAHLGGAVVAAVDGAETIIGPTGIPEDMQPPGGEDGHLTTVEFGGVARAVWIEGLGVQIASDLMKPVGIPRLDRPFGEWARLRASWGKAIRDKDPEHEGPFPPIDPVAPPGSTNRLTEGTEGGWIICNIEQKNIHTGECEITGSVECPVGGAEVSMGSAVAFGEGSVSMVGPTVSELSGFYLPLPDWCFFFLEWEAYGANQALLNPHGRATIGVCKSFAGCEDGCDTTFSKAPMVITNSPELADENGVGRLPTRLNKENPLEVVYNEGWIQPPAPEGGMFPGEERFEVGEHGGEKLVSSLLWSRAQIEAAIEFLQFHIKGEAGWHRLVLRVKTAVIPFWEGRQIGLHEGDLVDLTHTGWPITPSLEFGVPSGGKLLSRQTVGKTIIP